jgi:hypothetical protein
VVGDVIYIFGGRGVDGKDLGDLAAFNMSSQRWFIFQNMVVAPSGRSGHAMASVGTRVFVLGGESFTPTKSDDHGIINILETRHIKYPDLRNGNGLPANEVDRDLSVIPTLLPGEVTPGSPVDDIIDIINTVFGTRSPNYARTQSRPNTKDKASTRPRRDDRNVFGTDNGDWTKISATIDSNITARDHTLSPEQTRAPSHLPQDLTNELQGRSRYPITSGGFGDIWKCELVKPDGTVQVAVKTIRAFESDNEVLVRRNSRRVRRELKVWGRLKHDSILPLWGVATDFGPYPAMICPWADNGALTSYLERQESLLSSHDKFSLLNDIAVGLQYLHSKSVVHGDLTCV